jgi:hypothetical protein
MPVSTVVENQMVEEYDRPLYQKLHNKNTRVDTRQEAPMVD